MAQAYQFSDQDSQLVVTCSQLARTPALGHCSMGAHTALVEPLFIAEGLNGNSGSRLSHQVWPAGPSNLRGLTLNAIVVTTNGKLSALEQARTTLEVATPTASPPTTLNEISARSFSLITELEQMVDVVVIASLIIGGCSLAVGVTGGINDRKRPLSLLRLTGSPLRMLYKVIAYEAALPMVAVAVVSSALGLLTADLFLRAQLRESLVAPHGDYYLLLGVGLAVSLVVIACTLPLVRRITGPDTARNE